MSSKNISQLRFNFGFLLEAPLGTNRTMELAYPKVRVAEDLTLSPLNGRFDAVRTSEGIYVSGQLYSSTLVECMRCLDETAVSLDIQLDELYYYPPDTAPAGEYVVGEDGYLDLGPVVRELGLLAVPTQPKCNPDCLGLCDQCGQNLNEGGCSCEADLIDPRMAVLRQLLDN